MKEGELSLGRTLSCRRSMDSYSFSTDSDEVIEVLLLIIDNHIFMMVLLSAVRAST
jgi:hypothetical protein